MDKTQKIDLSKTYKTRGGDEVKLYAIDESLGDYPVVGARLITGGWILERWRQGGVRARNYELSSCDLVEVKPKRVAYLNVYPDGHATACTTRDGADGMATNDRVARIRVELEEGRFDD